MADTSTTTQIVAESPLLEQQKLKLLEDARKQVEQAGLAAQQGLYLTPDYRVAGMTPDQLDAIEAGRVGIGAYQPYLTRATQTYMDALGTTQGALGTLGGADTRGFFPIAQTAMTQSATPIAQMSRSAQDVMRGQRFIGEGAQGLRGGQNIISGGIGALGGAMQGYNPYSAQAFMNPYQQAVINESLRQINRQGDIDRQNLQAQMARAGAFGGGREAVQRAELNRNIMQQRNAAIVGALQQGYGAAQQQAQQAFEQQQQRQLAAGQAASAAGTQYGQLGAQTAGLSGLYGQLGSQQANIYGQQAQLGQQLGQGIAALAGQQFGIGQQLAQSQGQLGAQQGSLAGQIGALGAQQQAMGQQDINFLYNLGAQQQRQQQAILDAQRQNLLAQNMQPYQQLGFLSDIYKGAPTSQMAITSQSQPTPSPFQQIAGLGIAGVSAGAAGAKAGLF